MSNEEIEIFEFENILENQTAKQLYSVLQTASQEFSKVSVTIRKMNTLSYSIQQKKNFIFSKVRQNTMVLNQNSKFYKPSQIEEQCIEQKQSLFQHTASNVGITQETQGEDQNQNLIQRSTSRVRLPRLTMFKDLQDTSIQDYTKTNSTQRISKESKRSDLEISDQKYTQLSRRSRGLTLNKQVQELLVSQREDDPLSVNLYNDQKVKFSVQLQENFYYQRLQDVLPLITQGSFFEAKEQITQIYKETFQRVSRNSHSKTQFQIWCLVCVQCLYHLNQIFRYLAKYQKANYCLDQILSIFEISDPDLLGRIELEFAQNYMCDCKLIKALESYQKALVIYERFNWKLDIAYTLGKLSLALALLGEYEQAKKVCYEALAMQKQRFLEEDPRLAELHHNLGQAFFYSKEYEQSIHCFEQSLAKKEQMLINYLNIGLAMGKYISPFQLHQICWVWRIIQRWKLKNQQDFIKEPQNVWGNIFV